MYAGSDIETNTNGQSAASCSFCPPPPDGDAFEVLQKLNQQSKHLIYVYAKQRRDKSQFVDCGHILGLHSLSPSSPWTLRMKTEVISLAPVNCDI